MLKKKREKEKAAVKIRPGETLLYTFCWWSTYSPGKRGGRLIASRESEKPEKDGDRECRYRAGIKASMDDAAAINSLAPASYAGGRGIPCVLFVGVDEQRRLRGYLWPPKLQIKTVIVHSFARDRSVSSAPGNRFTARVIGPVIAYWIHQRFDIYFGLDSNNTLRGIRSEYARVRVEKLHKLEDTMEGFLEIGKIRILKLNSLSSYMSEKYLDLE